MRKVILLALLGALVLGGQIAMAQSSVPTSNNTSNNTTNNISNNTMNNTIIPAWSASKSFPVNGLVSYNGQIYRLSGHGNIQLSNGLFGTWIQWYLAPDMDVKNPSGFWTLVL